MDDISRFDLIFEKLHRKHAGKMSMPPELQLMFMIGGSAFTWHLVNKSRKARLEPEPTPKRKKKKKKSKRQHKRSRRSRHYESDSDDDNEMYDESDDDEESERDRLRRVYSKPKKQKRAEKSNSQPREMKGPLGNLPGGLGGLGRLGGLGGLGGLGSLGALSGLSGMATNMLPHVPVPSVKPPASTRPSSSRKNKPKITEMIEDRDDVHATTDEASPIRKSTFASPNLDLGGSEESERLSDIPSEELNRMDDFLELDDMMDLPAPSDAKVKMISIDEPKKKGRGRPKTSKNVVVI